MGRYYPKMIVRTSYGTGPYKIIDVDDHCDCPTFSDSITLFDKAPKSKEHSHIRCRKVGEMYGNYYLNGFDDNGNSVWSNDRIIVCAEETLLLTLFLPL